MTDSIEFQMSLLLAVALAGHLLSGLIRQPAVVGQILAGLVVGPSVYGWIIYTTFVAKSPTWEPLSCYSSSASSFAPGSLPPYGLL